MGPDEVEDFIQTGNLEPNSRRDLPVPIDAEVAKKIAEIHANGGRLIIDPPAELPHGQE